MARLTVSLSSDQVQLVLQALLVVSTAPEHAAVKLNAINALQGALTEQGQARTLKGVSNAAKETAPGH